MHVNTHGLQFPAELDKTWQFVGPRNPQASKEAMYSWHSNGVGCFSYQNLCVIYTYKY